MDIPDFNIIPYMNAVNELAEIVRGCDHYIFGLTTDQVGYFGGRISPDDFNGWRIYHHANDEIVGVLTSAIMLKAAYIAQTVVGEEAIFLFTVPKTVGRDGMRKIFGFDFPEGNDILFNRPEDGKVYYPRILVDAFEEVSPTVAAAIRNNEVR
jgi:hypothetical protein